MRARENVAGNQGSQSVRGLVQAQLSVFMHQKRSRKSKSERVVDSAADQEAFQLELPFRLSIFASHFSRPTLHNAIHTLSTCHRGRPQKSLTAWIKVISIRHRRGSTEEKGNSECKSYYSGLGGYTVEATRPMKEGFVTRKRALHEDEDSKEGKTIYQSGAGMLRSKRRPWQHTPACWW